MAADPRALNIEKEALRRASSASRSLAASLPRLTLEARRIAATVVHGLHGRRRAGSGENFWQYRHFSSGEAAQARRLAALRARRSSLCARAGMGSRAHGVDLARPFALDGVRLAARLGNETRSRADHRVCAGRDHGRRRRTCRHSRIDAADREPQCHRQDGAGLHSRHRRARQPAAELRALAAVGSRDALGFLVADRPR